MSVCGRVAFCGSYAPRQWRGRGRRATGEGGFSQAFCRGFRGACGAESIRRGNQVFNSDLMAAVHRIAPRDELKSALQQRLDPLVEFLEPGSALDHLAI